MESAFVYALSGGVRDVPELIQMCSIRLRTVPYGMSFLKSQEVAKEPTVIPQTRQVNSRSARFYARLRRR